MTDYIQITTTTENEEQALDIARILVERRLAACVQVSGPINSVYRWKDKIELSREWVCMIKSTNELYKKIEKTILEMHPYEVPEILAVPITEGNRDYLKWVDEETGED